MKMRGQVLNTGTDGRCVHGLSKTMIYKKYHHAKDRCKPNYRDHERYYDRGIRFLWKSFEEFYKDMNDSYVDHCEKYGTENTTLDRIDNNGHYCKENCRWATHKEQSMNRRSCNKFIYEGIEYKTIQEFCDINGHNPHTISTRMNRDGMNIVDAIEIKLNSMPKKGKSVVYKGKTYPSISELCREKKINKNTIFVRMHRQNMTLEDAIDAPI